MRHSVQLDASHLEAIGQTPSKGLQELVWNAIDADATNIEIAFDRNEIGGIIGYRIRDDGTGISPRDANEHFLTLGGSWKPKKTRSAGGRQLHGSLGQGRYCALSNGGRVLWESVAKEGERHIRTRIEIDSDDLDVCEISEPVECDGPTYTEVRVEGMAPPVHRLGTPSDFEDFTVKFALPIQAYSLNITYDGERADPAGLYNRVEELELGEYDGNRALLTVIEWSRVPGRTLYLCDSSGIALQQMDSRVKPRGVRYSAYVKWDGFKNYSGSLEVADLLSGKPGVLLEDVEEGLLSYFRRRSDEHRREVVDQWREDGIYPFAGDPLTPAQQATRDMFDIVALEAREVIDVGEKRAKKLSLRLLKEALERSPSAVQHVLEDVLGLPDEKVEELSVLLEKTPLSKVISASTAISDRLEFLEGLRILTGTDLGKKHVKERSQLHKILENETWVFGEEYALAISDEGLTRALEEHTKYVKGVDSTEREVVVGRDGRRRIFDLMFSAKIPQSENRKHHLVVELKRPGVDVGPEELQQLKDYALAVAEDERFDARNVSWDFWVLSAGVTGSADMDRRQSGRPYGLVVEYEEKRVRVWVKTWAEVLDLAEHRLKFVQNALGYSPGSQEALAYLKRKHEDYVPDEVVGSGEIAETLEV